MELFRMKPLWARLARAWKLWVGLVGLVLIMVWASDGFRSRVKPGLSDGESGRPLPEDARLLTVAETWIHPSIQVAGTVASERTIHLSARLAAYVREVSVTSGEHVAAGDVLVTLDDRDLNEKRAATEAHMARAEAEFARVERLTASGAATPRDFDLAQATLVAARADVEQVRVVLSDTRIRAPIDGIVSERRIEAGDLASPGQVLLVLFDPARMRFEAHVPIRLLRHFPVGAEREIALEFPERQWVGRVTEKVGSIDPATRTRLVKFRIEPEDRDLVPGAFGRVRLDGDAYAGIRIPAGAVRRVGQLEAVDAVVGDRVVRRLITTCGENDGGVEVRSGLRAGDRILAEPLDHDRP